MNLIRHFRGFDEMNAHSRDATVVVSDVPDFTEALELLDRFKAVLLYKSKGGDGIQNTIYCKIKLGISRCHPDDKFIKKIGSLTALSKLQKARVSEIRGKGDSIDISIESADFVALLKYRAKYKYPEIYGYGIKNTSVSLNTSNPVDFW